MTIFLRSSLYLSVPLILLIKDIENTSSKKEYLQMNSVRMTSQMHDITNACKYDNECVKIFLNSKQAKYNNVSKELKQFLDYVNTQKTTDVFTERIEEKVNFINKRDRRILMSFQEDLNDAKKAGIEEGKASGFIEGQASGLRNEKIAIAKTMIQEHFSNEMISKITKLSFDEIKDLRNESVN